MTTHRLQAVDTQPDTGARPRDAGEETPSSDVIVGRQAIAGPDQRVLGYELLRRSTAGSGSVPAADFVTAAELLSGAPDDLERLVGGGFALLGVDAQACREAPRTRSGQRTVVQLIRPELTIPEIVVESGGLSRRGYRIAVDLATVRADTSGELAASAGIISVPAGTLPPDALARVAGQYRRPHRRLLATGVDTADSVQACRAAGFDYLQGYAVPSPQHTSGRALEASRFGPMRLAASLLGGAFELSELENILRIEPAMTYQLLRLAGAGADNGMRRQIRSIREALVLIGSTRLQSWIALLLLRNETEDQVGAVSMALARARMCEVLIRAESPKLAPLGFTAGILSAFDLLLGVEMSHIASELPLDDMLREAAFGQANRVAQVRHDVTEYQTGRIDSAPASGLSTLELDAASIASIRWAEMAAWTFSDSATA